MAFINIEPRGILENAIRNAAKKWGVEINDYDVTAIDGDRGKTDAIVLECLKCHATATIGTYIHATGEYANNQMISIEVEKAFVNHKTCAQRTESVTQMGKWNQEPQPEPEKIAVPLRPKRAYRLQ